MQTTYNLLKSRTFWLLVLAALIPVANAVVPTLPMGIQDIATTLLSLAAIYTHQNGMVKAGATN